MSRYRIKEFLILIILLIFSIQLFAQVPKIKFTTLPDVYVLYNTDNQKMYSYYRVPSNESIDFTASHVDTLEIYSRIFYENGGDSKSYQYVISYDSQENTIHKTCRQSNITRGVTGKAISTYNKLRIILSKMNNEIKIFNLSPEVILFKIGYNSFSNFSSKHEYISYSPSGYEDEKVLRLDDREYTYYDSGSDAIKFDLEGPIYLKIISRVIFHMPGTKKIDYQFEVYDNGNLFSKFNEVGHKSLKTILTDNIEFIPSTGDVNILHFDKGKHYIEIRKTSNNHSVIFRFYINKTAVFVGDK